MIPAVGAVVGWLAGLIVKSGGSGFGGNVLIGIARSSLAGFLRPLVGVTFGQGTVGALVPSPDRCGHSTAGPASRSAWSRLTPGRWRRHRGFDDESMPFAYVDYP